MVISDSHLNFSIPIKREFTSPCSKKHYPDTIYLSKMPGFLKICLQSISNVNDRQRNVPVSPAQKGTVSARGMLLDLPPSVKRPTVTAR